MILAAFCVQESAWAAPMAMPITAAPMPELRFKVPASAGMMDDYYRAPRQAVATSAGPAEKLIVLVQDAHTNDSAQFNAASVLQEVLTSEDVRLVFTEADHGNVSLSYLKKYADAAALEKVAASFVRKGLLKGTEYLSITSDRDFVLQGVESPVLYDESLRAYANVAKERDRALAWLDRLQRSLKTLQQDAFSPELSRLETERLKKNSGELSIAAYAETLWKRAGSLGIYRGDYRRLADLNRVSRLEKKVRFNEAAQEAEAAMETLDGPVRRRLADAAGPSARASAVRTGEDASAGFYEALESALLARPDGGKLNRTYPSLSGYFRYLHQARRLEALRAIDELDALEAQVYARTAKSAEERYLVEFGRNAEDLESVLRLKLSPEAFERFAERQKRFDPRMIGGYVNHRILQTSKHYDAAVFLDRQYERAAEEAVRFYRLAAKRDHVFVDRIVRQMDQAGESRAALFMGGFHAPGIKRLLRDRGISYVSILPNVTHETDQSRYEKVLLSQDPSGRGSRAVTARAQTRLAAAQNAPFAAQPLGAIDGGRLPFFEAVARTGQAATAQDLLEEGRSQQPFGDSKPIAAARLASIHQAIESGRSDVIFWDREVVPFDGEHTMEFLDFKLRLSAPSSDYFMRINAQARENASVRFDRGTLIIGDALDNESFEKGSWSVSKGSVTSLISFPLSRKAAAKAQGKIAGYLNVEISDPRYKDRFDESTDRGSSVVLKVYWTRNQPVAPGALRDYRIGNREPSKAQQAIVAQDLRTYAEDALTSGKIHSTLRRTVFIGIDHLENRGIRTLAQLGGAGMWELFEGNRVSADHSVTVDFIRVLSEALAADGIYWGYDPDFSTRGLSAQAVEVLETRRVSAFIHEAGYDGQANTLTRGQTAFAKWFGLGRLSSRTESPMLARLYASSPLGAMRDRNMGVATLGEGMEFLDQQASVHGFPVAWGRGFAFRKVPAQATGARMSQAGKEGEYARQVLEALRWVRYPQLEAIKDQVHAETGGLVSDTNRSLQFLSSGLSIPDKKALAGQYALYVDLGGSTIHIGITGINAETAEEETLWHQDILLSDREKKNGRRIFDRIADIVAQKLAGNEVTSLLRSKGLTAADLAGGFTFSFTHKDGIIQKEASVKGFKFTNVVGRSVLELINDRLERLGVDFRFNAVVNDADAALVQGILVDPRTRAAVIGGTGFNLSAVINETIFNLEAGGFRIQDLTRVRLLETEKKFVRRGAENLIAGGYLGELVRLILLDLAEQGVLFKEVYVNPYNVFAKNYRSRLRQTRWLRTPHSLSTTAVFQTLNLSSPRSVRSILNDSGNYAVDATEADLALVQKVIQAAGYRSADIVAAMAAGVLTAAKGAKDGRVSADGALWQNDWYLSRVNETLGRLLNRTQETDILFRVHNASGQAGALTALAKRAVAEAQGARMAERAVERIEEVSAVTGSYRIISGPSQDMTVWTDASGDVQVSQSLQDWFDGLGITVVNRVSNTGRRGLYVGDVTQEEVRSVTLDLNVRGRNFKVIFHPDVLDLAKNTLAEAVAAAGLPAAARMAAKSDEALVPWTGTLSSLETFVPRGKVVLTDPIKALAVTIGYFPDLYETVRDNPFVQLAGAMGDYGMAEEVGDLVRDIVGPVAEVPYVADADKFGIRLFFLRYGLHVYLRTLETMDGKVLLTVYATPYDGDPHRPETLRPDQKREFALIDGGDGKIWEQDPLIGTAVFRASLTSRLIELLQELSGNNKGVGEFLSAYEEKLTRMSPFTHLGEDDMAVRWADARAQRQDERETFKRVSAWEERIQRMSYGLRDEAVRFGGLATMRFGGEGQVPEAALQDVAPSERASGYFKAGDRILIDTREWGIPPSGNGPSAKGIVTSVWEDTVSYDLVTDDGRVDSRIGADEPTSPEIWKWNSAIEPFTPEDRPLAQLEHVDQLALPKELTDYIFSKLQIFYPQMLALLLERGELKGGALTDEQVDEIAYALRTYQPAIYQEPKEPDTEFAAGARMASVIESVSLPPDWSIVAHALPAGSLPNEAHFSLQSPHGIAFELFLDEAHQTVRTVPGKDVVNPPYALLLQVFEQITARTGLLLEWRPDDEASVAAFLKGANSDYVRSAESAYRWQAPFAASEIAGTRYRLGERGLFRLEFSSHEGPVVLLTEKKNDAQASESHWVGASYIVAPKKTVLIAGAGLITTQIMLGLQSLGLDVIFATRSPLNAIPAARSGAVQYLLDEAHRKNFAGHDDMVLNGTAAQILEGSGPRVDAVIEGFDGKIGGTSVSEVMRNELLHRFADLGIPVIYQGGAKFKSSTGRPDPAYVNTFVLELLGIGPDHVQEGSSEMKCFSCNGTTTVSLLASLGPALDSIASVRAEFRYDRRNADYPAFKGAKPEDGIPQHHHTDGDILTYLESLRASLPEPLRAKADLKFEETDGETGLHTFQTTTTHNLYHRVVARFRVHKTDGTFMSAEEFSRLARQAPNLAVANLPDFFFSEKREAEAASITLNQIAVNRLADLVIVKLRYSDPAITPVVVRDSPEEEGSIDVGALTFQRSNVVPANEALTLLELGLVPHHLEGVKEANRRGLETHGMVRLKEEIQRYFAAEASGARMASAQRRSKPGRAHRSSRGARNVYANAVSTLHQTEQMFLAKNPDRYSRAEWEAALHEMERLEGMFSQADPGTREHGIQRQAAALIPGLLQMVERSGWTQEQRDFQDMIARAADGEPVGEWVSPEADGAESAARLANVEMTVFTEGVPSWHAPGKKVILVVEDEPLLVKLHSQKAYVAKHFESQAPEGEYEWVVVTSLNDAKEVVDAAGSDLAAVFTDNDFPVVRDTAAVNDRGIELIRYIGAKAETSGVKGYLVSGLGALIESASVPSNFTVLIKGHGPIASSNTGIAKALADIVAAGARMSALIEGHPTAEPVQNAFVKWTIQSKSGPAVINEAVFTDLGAKLVRFSVGENGSLRPRQMMRRHEDGSKVMQPNGLAVPDGTPLMLPTSSRVRQGKVTALDGTVVDLKDALFTRKFPDLAEGPHTLHGILDKVVWDRVPDAPRPDAISFVKRYRDVPLFTPDSEREREAAGLPAFEKLYPGVRTLADIYGDIEVRVNYLLKGQELISELVFRNLSDRAVPLSGGFHPFPQIAEDDEVLKDWSVRLPAGRTLPTDTTSRVPLRPAEGTPLLRDVTGTDADVRRFTQLRPFEDILTDLVPAEDGRVHGQFVNRKTGEVIEFSWNPKQFPYAVLWVPMANGAMKGVASIEPTLSAPDAFQLAEEGYSEALPLTLDAGATFRASYSMRRTTVAELALTIDDEGAPSGARAATIDYEGPRLTFERSYFEPILAEIAKARSVGDVGKLLPLADGETVLGVLRLQEESGEAFYSVVYTGTPLLKVDGKISLRKSEPGAAAEQPDLTSLFDRPATVEEVLALDEAVMSQFESIRGSELGELLRPANYEIDMGDFLKRTGSEEPQLVLKKLVALFDRANRLGLGSFVYIGKLDNLPVAEGGLGLTSQPREHGPTVRLWNTNDETMSSVMRGFGYEGANVPFDQKSGQIIPVFGTVLAANLTAILSELESTDDAEYAALRLRLVELLSRLTSSGSAQHAATVDMFINFEPYRRVDEYAKIAVKGITLKGYLSFILYLQQVARLAVESSA